MSITDPDDAAVRVAGPVAAAPHPANCRTPYRAPYSCHRRHYWQLLPISDVADEPALEPVFENHARHDDTGAALPEQLPCHQPRWYKIDGGHPHEEAPSRNRDATEQQ